MSIVKLKKGGKRFEVSVYHFLSYISVLIAADRLRAIRIKYRNGEKACKEQTGNHSYPIILRYRNIGKQIWTMFCRSHTSSLMSRKASWRKLVISRKHSES